MTEPFKASEQARSTSHGRGGAGNITSKPPTNVGANDLSTPTIKSATYTTGRGGTGNMATNDPSNPASARAAQDVEAPPPRETKGTYHWGRGGEGNQMYVGDSKRDGSQEPEKGTDKSERKASKGAAERRGSFRDAIKKSVLGGLGGSGKKGQTNGGSAVMTDDEEVEKK